MSFLQATRIALVFGAVTLASCDSATDPIQPSASGGESAAAPEFAAASNSWEPRRFLPRGRMHMGAGVVKNSAGQPIVYLLGGVRDGGNGQVVEAYNYSTDTWETKRAVEQRSHSNGVGVIGGKLYLSGGTNGLNRLASLVVYDPVRDAFTRKANMPTRSVSGVTGAIGGKLYVLTGYGTDGKVTRRFFRYDPATDTWTSLTSPPQAHADGVGGVIKGKFYVAGGQDESNVSHYSNKLHVYDPATNKWKTLAPSPEALPRRAGAVIQDRLYLVGGGGQGKVHAYDPVTNTWQARASLRSWRIDLAAVGFVSRAGNPRILALGGQGDDDWPSNWNEVYTP